MLTLKEIKKEVEKRGLNFDEWRKNTIDKKMLALISKEKEVFNDWELRELNDSLFKLLLINNSAKNISVNKIEDKNVQQHAKNNKQITK